MKGTPLSLVVLVGFSAACVMAPPPEETDSGTPAQQGVDSGVQQPPPTTDAGATGGILPVGVDGGSLTLDPALALPVPPAPSPDDPAACAPQVVATPDFSAQPDRPCTEEDASGTSTYRYDAAGRVVYRAVHKNDGYEATYTSEDDGGVRIETWVGQGRTWKQDVTELKDGKPVEADYFKVAADGGLVLDGHSTWLYDDQGRQQLVISQYSGITARVVERNFYDMKGRLYFVDQSHYWPGKTTVANHSFTERSWFANGALAHEIQTCDIAGGPPCGILEKRWEPCGNLAYIGDQPAMRPSSFTDWSWDRGGRPLARHARWYTTTNSFNSTESYRLDGAGRVISGAILITNPPNYGLLPPTEQHETSYTYDDAGHLIERLLDGRTDFHARFDAAGRVLERDTVRWTYDGCGR
jgi:YD repeat-containing protein